jgi:hypothetical protein
VEDTSSKIELEHLKKEMEQLKISHQHELKKLTSELEKTKEDLKIGTQFFLVTINNLKIANSTLKEKEVKLEALKISTPATTTLPPISVAIPIDFLAQITNQVTQSIRGNPLPKNIFLIHL